jgi:hypothetical protein
MVKFQTQNHNLGKFLVSLEMENFGIFYGRWEHSMAIYYIL